MAFTFFTLGGKQFWEDVFFYQKWRIQRHCLTKRYRLLDNWDIRRASGSFERCRQSLNRCIEVFQLPSHKERAIVMLHGLTGNKNQFNQMVKMAESEGFTAITLNYPSTRKNLNTHLRQLEFLLNGLSGIKEISFITDGIGGIILRELLACDSEWKRRCKIQRVVQINPPNRGFRLWEQLSENKFALFILGPLIKLGDSRKISKVARFPDGIELGIINTHNRIGKLLSQILPAKWQNLLPQIGDSFLPGAKDIADIKTFRTNPAANRMVIRCCRDFIRLGKF